MSCIRKCALVFGVLLMLFSLTGCDEDEVAKVGEIAPRLTVLTLDGDIFQEKPWVNGAQYTYLNFWSASCAPCMVELSYLQQLSQEYQGRVHIFSVNIDQEVASYALLTKFSSSYYPILYDPLGITAERYQVRGTPLSYIIDDQGTVKEMHMGMRSFDELHDLFEAMATKNVI